LPMNSTIAFSSMVLVVQQISGEKRKLSRRLVFLLKDLKELSTLQQAFRGWLN